MPRLQTKNLGVGEQMIIHGKGKMFPFITQTWNPLAMKCKHECYNMGCWAEALKKGKLQHTKKYGNLTDEVTLHVKELCRKFKDNDTVFVEDMGDLFGEWVPASMINVVLKVIKENPQAKFLLLTKNPLRIYREFADRITENCIVGATIETHKTIADQWKAPPVAQRILALEAFDFPHKMISIEPIMDFDLTEFVTILKRIRGLERVAVGYDNYTCGFEEPTLEKTKLLIAELDLFVPEVYVKSLREKREVKLDDGNNSN